MGFLPFTNRMFMDMDKASQSRPLIRLVTIGGIEHPYIPFGMAAMIFFMFLEIIQWFVLMNYPLYFLEECGLVALYLYDIVVLTPNNCLYSFFWACNASKNRVIPIPCN